MALKRTAPMLQAYKGSGNKIVCLTAYDVVSGRLAEMADVDLVLVGDSVGNVVMGLDSTVAVTLEAMEHHVRATRAGVTNALLVGDLPFGSYNSSVGQAVDSAVRLMQAGAAAVKLEGDYPDEVAAMVKAGIPVMGHVGFTPQSVNVFGGHRVQGKDDGGDAILEVCRRLVDAGVFGIVLELVPGAVAKRLTEELPVPTIGIGAGSDCDGQVQVFHDIVGFSEKEYKHARRFADGLGVFGKAVSDYADSVRKGTFPTEDNTF